MKIREDKSMDGYLAYRDFMAELAGQPVDREARAQRWADLGITTRDLRWDGPKNSAVATVFFEHSIPSYITWFIWDISDDNFIANLERDLGRKVKVADVTGGNGHYAARLEVTSDCE